jgi:hypothetical protein
MKDASGLIFNVAPSSISRILPCRCRGIELRTVPYGKGLICTRRRRAMI